MVYYHVYAYFMLFFYRLSCSHFGALSIRANYTLKRLSSSNAHSWHGTDIILYIHALAVRTGRACAIVNHFCFNVDEIASTISWNILRSYGEKVITHELMAEII